MLKKKNKSYKIQFEVKTKEKNDLTQRTSFDIFQSFQPAAFEVEALMCLLFIIQRLAAQISRVQIIIISLLIILINNK